MAYRHAAPLNEQPPRTRVLSPRPVHKPLVAVAILSMVVGLLLFAQAQTQPLFQNQGGDAASTQNLRDDGGILLGAVLTATGLGLLVALLSPLHPSRRLLPVGIFATITGFLLAAHLSIFNNGIAFPGQNAFAVQTTYLFADTQATLAITPFILAWLTLIAIITAGLALWALLAPNSFQATITRPTTLHAHRARLFLLTLLVLAAGSAFIRQFLGFAIHAATRLDTRALSVTYVLLAILVTALLVSLAVRTAPMLWGRLEHRRSPHSRRRHARALRIEATIWALALIFTVITLMGDAVWQPNAGTDPVFAMNSTGLSWVFLIVLVLVLLHKHLSRSYTRHLQQTEDTLPVIKRDRLLILGLTATTAWTLGALWSLQPGITPLTALTLRILPVVLLLPLFALPATAQTKPTLGSSRPLLLFTWAATSLLAALLLWGIANTTHIQFSRYGGGLATTGGGLIQGTDALLRMLAAALIATPLVLTLRAMARSQGRRLPVGLSLVTGAMAFFLVQVLFTIQTGIHHDTSTGQTQVFVGTWAHTLNDANATTLISSLIALTLILGLTALTLLLHRSIEVTEPPTRSLGWTRILEENLPRASRMRQRELEARTRIRVQARMSDE